MVRRRLAVVALAVPLLLVSVPACRDNRPQDKIMTETVPLPGPPVGSAGPGKAKGKSQFPAQNEKVD
jgi:hypothetical protein